MATVTFTSDAPLSIVAPVRILTAGDVAALPRQLPSGPVDYELDNGRLVIMPPCGDAHSTVQARLAGELYNQGDKRGLGQVKTESGILLRQGPDRLVGADVAFVCSESLPVKKSKEGYLETIPQLAVEIRSKNDSEAYLRGKVAEYLAAGARVVWVVDPAARIVEAHRIGATPQIFREGQPLTCEDVIPGLAIDLTGLLANL